MNLNIGEKVRVKAQGLFHRREGVVIKTHLSNALVEFPEKGKVSDLGYYKADELARL